MKKPLNLGDLSQSLQPRQQLIQDILIDQMKSDLSDLNQTIKDCVTSEVSRYLSGLSQELKADQSQSVTEITTLQNSLVSRIEQLIMFQPLTETFERIERLLQQQQQDLVELQSRINQNFVTQAQQVTLQMEQRCLSEQQDYQTFLSEQQFWRSNLVKQVNQQIRQPILNYLILLSVIAVSLSVNLTLIFEAGWGRTLFWVIVGVLILMVVGTFLYYAIANFNHTKEQ